MAQLLLIIVGLLIMAYPFTLGAHPDVTCRGALMHPGDVCRKADGTGVQSYEQRAAAVRNARPVIVGVGVVVTGFGAMLLTGENRRRRRTPPPGANDTPR
ncbi:hypothetical protein GCM10009841_15520 [Microlunatus panaciterrae]